MIILNSMVKKSFTMRVKEAGLSNWNLISRKIKSAAEAKCRQRRPQFIVNCTMGLNYLCELEVTERLIEIF